MTDSPPNDPVPGPDADVPYEHEDDLEVEDAPRRAASAEFVVDTPVGSQAMLREAMDPANQSLAEALRLSFRVLQVVILVLIVLFVFSGFQTVQEGQSGVLLRWGKILSRDGREALEPGLKFSRWPYPAGEFVLFDVKGRPAAVGNDYWPDLRGSTLQEAVETATLNRTLRPGRDGMVLTRGGDIAHIQLAAQYDVDEPARFVYCVENADPDGERLDAERLVRLSLERAIVHLAADRTLQEFVDMTDGGEQVLLATAQEMLDEVGSGIRIVGVDTPMDPTPALAIKRAYGQLQEARVRAKENVEKARLDAHTTLLGTAGYNYRELVDLVGQYEDAYALGDTDRADALLAQIDVVLESEGTSGRVTAILNRAHGYRATIESTLGEDARRFANILPLYRRNPSLIVSRLWAEAYTEIMSQDDIEIYQVPKNGGVLRLAIKGQDHIRETRRENSVLIRQNEAWLQGLDIENQYIQRGNEMNIDGPGRQLSETAGSLRNR